MTGVVANKMKKDKQRLLNLVGSRETLRGSGNVTATS